MTSATYGAAPKTNDSVTVNRPSKGHAIFHAIMVFVVMIVLLGIPFWLLVVTAGKTQAEAVVPNMSLPSQWHLLENFKTVLVDGKMIAALFGSMASWILARRTTKLLAVVYALGISGLILPPAVVTVMMLLKIIGLSGTAVGMVGVYVGIYMSTVIFFVTGFIRTIPVSLEEAARVDGAKPIRIFFTIILPLLGPTLATATILVTLYIWNDVFYSLFILSGKMDLLPLNLYNVASAGLYLNNWHLIFAYIILMSLPLLIIFALAQKKIISGITGGAVK